MINHTYRCNDMRIFEILMLQAIINLTATVATVWFLVH